MRAWNTVLEMLLSRFKPYDAQLVFARFRARWFHLLRVTKI